MSAQPAISVVVPTRNRAHYLLEALGSVFAQTFTDFEIIVVDDGSIDETKKLLSPLIESGRIRYFYKQAAGVSPARNFGVEVANSSLIAFLDSDDLFLPTKLEKQINLFNAQPGLGFVHCNFSKFDNTGRDLGARDVSAFRGAVYPWMLHEWSSLMAMPCMMIPKGVFLRAGGFDETMRWAEDLDLWRRIARNHPVDLVPEVLVKVRVHSGGASFARGQAGEGFEKYLTKALAEDPDLSKDFSDVATAKMYSKLGQNLLGDGSHEDMGLVRRYSRIALKVRPLQLGAQMAWLASYLPYHIRHSLVSVFRRAQYKATR